MSCGTRIHSVAPQQTFPRPATQEEGYHLLNEFQTYSKYKNHRILWKCTDFDGPGVAFELPDADGWTAIVRATAVFCFFLSRPVIT